MPTIQAETCVISHRGADFDALASMICAQKLHPDSVMVFTGPASKEVEEFVILHRSLIQVLEPKEVDLSSVKRIVMVDTRDPARVGPFRPLVQDLNMEVLIYDHHPDHARDVKGDVEQVESVGGAVTLLLERLHQQGLRLNSAEATAALIALHHETGSFRFDATTPRDFRAAAWLLEWDANMEWTRRFTDWTLNRAQLELFQELLQAGHVHDVRGFRVILCSVERERHLGGLARLTQRLLEIEEVDCALVLARMGRKTHLVARSRTPEVDVGALARSFGGGGHRGAASATATEISEVEVMDFLENSFPAARRARDIMTRRVEVLDADQELSAVEAVEELRRLGHTAVCVTRAGQVVGMLARSDLDKALAHKMGQAPATRFMTTKVLSVEPETPVSEIRKLLVRRDIGRVPVMENGEMVGLVSRTDVLAATEEGAPTPGPDRRRSPDLASELLRLETHALDYLRCLGLLADSRQIPIYAVGGFVRDLMLGVGSQDLDLVVEGDAIEFGQLVAEATHSEKHRSYELYRTIQLFYPGPPFEKVDFASARTERYCRPAAKPTVKGSTLKQDLFRRDFTINCLALWLNRAHFGELVDFFGGRQDLDSGLVRVLHNHSFVDDPSRIIRAVRFEQRLRFHIEAHTLHLLSQAVHQGVLNLDENDRVMEEIRLALAEEAMPLMMERLSRLKVLASLFPELRFDQKVKARLERCQEVPHFLKGEYESWQLAWLTLVSRSSENGLAQALGPVSHDPERFRELQKRLSAAHLGAGEIDAILSTVSQLEAAYLWVLGGGRVEERLDLFFTRLKSEPSLVGGKQLIEWGLSPGPQFKVLLARLRAAQLNGEIGTLDQARTLLSEGLLSSP